MCTVICVKRKTAYFIGFIILFALFFIAYSSFSQTLLSRKISTNSRASESADNLPIANGELALDNEFPYFVKIKSSKGFCGGTLISEEYILTAAHCVYGEYMNGGVIQILIGVNHYYGEYKGHYAGFVRHSPPKEENTVGKISNLLITKIYGNQENIFIPDEYKESMFFDRFDRYSESYDIAILKLEIKAIGVPTLSLSNAAVEKELIDGHPITVIGVGRNEANERSNDLWKASLNVGGYRGQPTSIVYLTSKDKPAKNTCLGDSGGPAIFDGAFGKKYIMGITSGSTCQGGESYYTSTAFHSVWITSTTGKAGKTVEVNSGTATNDLSLHPTQQPLSADCTAQKSEEDCDKNSSNAKVFPCGWSRSRNACEHIGS